jgi:uncharacterized repeat protein (TIGR01451 family)
VPFLVVACLGSSAVFGAIFTVTNTSDSGAGSLRQALLDADAGSAVNTIQFNIPGGGVKTITPVTNLPDVPANTSLDGFSQPGSAPNTLNDGSNAVLLIEIHGPGGGGDGLRLPGQNGVSGLVLNGWNGAGAAGIHVLTNAFQVLVEACYIGTNAAGTAAVPNTVGIHLDGGAEIGSHFNFPSTLTSAGARTLISGNTEDGIHVDTGGIIQVIGAAHIGVAANGLTKLGNGGDGIEIANSTVNQIGLSPIDEPGLSGGNLIGGNGGAGVRISGAGAFFNFIYWAFIGTDRTGTVNLGNTGPGVLIEGGSYGNGVGGFYGFTGVGEQVVVAFNGGAGVAITGAGADNHVDHGAYYGNTGRNVDLGNDGATANDSCDGDSGPNNLLNTAVLSATSIGGDGLIHVTGTLDTAIWLGPNHILYNVFYYTAPNCNPANPNIVRYTGDIGQVPDPPVCANAFDHPLPMLTLHRQPEDDYLVGITLTDGGPTATGGTSEISNCIALPSQATPGVNLSLQKTAAPDPATEGLPLVYTLQVTNNGLTNAQNVMVSDPLPPGTSYLTGDSGCSFSNGSQTVTCSFGTITANGSNASHQFSVVPTGPGTVTNTATASSSVTDDDTADNSDTAVTPVSMAVYDLEATTTGGGFSCPPNAKKQICTLGDTLSFLNNDVAYFTGDLELTSTCKKPGTTSVSCKIKGSLQVNLFQVLGVAPHEITAYLSADTAVDAGDIAIATAPTSLLAALAPKGKTVKINYKHPKGQSYPASYILLKLDSLGAVSETDETNNVLVVGSFP